jgi:hypothetical protein
LQYTGAYEPTPAFEFWRMRSGVFHRFQNTVAFKDLQSEIKILSESQRTFLPLLLKEIAR